MRQNSTPSDLIKQLRDNNPTVADHASDDVPPPWGIRKLSLAWEDGRKRLFYYHYLMDVDFLPGEDVQYLTLHFMGQTVKLKGVNLDHLYARFVEREPAFIRVTNPRYTALADNGHYLVTEAILEK